MTKLIDIICVTGFQGSGKTTHLQNLITKNISGVLTKCINREQKRYNFILLPSFDEFECCSYDFLTKTMVFNNKSFDKVNNFIKSINSGSIIIDEIGRLELFDKGLSSSFRYIIDNVNRYNAVYIGIRYDILESLLKKYGFLPKEIVLLKKTDKNIF